MTSQTAESHGMLIGGEWCDDGEHGRTLLRSPYDGAVLAEVPLGGPGDVERAVAAASGALTGAELPRAERIRILEDAARALAERTEEFARVIADECAKPVKTARIEVRRSSDTFAFAAAEARTRSGETVPVDAVAAGQGKTAYTLRVPIGVVAAIAPFNFPLNLVAHKVAPAIAAGCAVVLKPASQTPLSSLLLARLLTDVGLPPGWLNVVVGSGAQVGTPLVDHPAVRYVTFTGSPEVGWAIAARAPRKKVRLELGSNAPLIVDADSDWRTAAAKAASAGFVQSGQSCVSTQRIFVHQKIAEGFVAALLAGVGELIVGDPHDERTDVSALISPSDAERVQRWIKEAVTSGATVRTGGERVGNAVTPTVLTGVTRSMDVQCREVFGPVVTVTEFGDFGEAIAMANDSDFGLNAGVFTRDIGKALRATRELEYGSVFINDVPTVRADQQPYGGIKDSGNTREGPRYAIEEMTELRLITLQ